MKRITPEEIFRSHGGTLRMSEALAQGINRYTLYSMRDNGTIEQVSRGVYRLAELPALSDPDLVTVSLRFPNAVVCLISALSFHKITTQIPHEVYVAVSRASRLPALEFPPVHAYRFSDSAFEAGIEKHVIDGVSVRVYSMEKTLVDCFKYRNKIGLDVALEALKLYRARKPFNLEQIVHFARICRVYKIITPYLEMTI